MNKVCIIIINYKITKNNLRVLMNIANWDIDHSIVKVVLHLHCVNELYRQEICDYINTIKQFYEVEYYFFDHHPGFAQSFNKAYERLGNEFKYIMRLDNDLFLYKDSFKKMISFLENNEEVAVLGPKIYDGYNPRLINAASIKINWLGLKNKIIDSFTPVESDTLLGACMLFRKSVLNKIGRVFNEKYMLFAEEGEICQEIKKLGYKVFYFPDAIGWHFYGKFSSMVKDLSVYLSVRNNVMFYVTYSRFKVLSVIIQFLLVLKRFIKNKNPLLLTAFFDGLFFKEINKKLLRNQQ